MIGYRGRKNFVMSGKRLEQPTSRVSQSNPTCVTPTVHLPIIQNTYPGIHSKFELNLPPFQHPNMSEPTVLIDEDMQMDDATTGTGFDVEDSYMATENGDEYDEEEDEEEIDELADDDELDMDASIVDAPPGDTTTTTTSKAKSGTSSAKGKAAAKADEEEEAEDPEEDAEGSKPKPKAKRPPRKPANERTPGSSLLPTSRVTKIMKADKDLGLTAKEAVFLVSVATVSMPFHPKLATKRHLDGAHAPDLGFGN